MGWGHSWLWDLQRHEPSLMVRSSYLDQGVNRLFPGEVYFCPLLSRL